MSDGAAPFRDFLHRALDGAGLDRKSFAKAMGGNPSKFYRRYDSWVKGALDVAGGRRYEVPDLPNIQKLAEVLGVDEAAVLRAVREQLALTNHTMTDKGKIQYQPSPPPAALLADELAWLESLCGHTLEPDLRAKRGLFADALVRLQAWSEADNAFERLRASTDDELDWLLFFGGLLEIDDHALDSQTRLFACLRPHAIRTPVLLWRGYEFQGFVAADVPALVDLLDGLTDGDEEPEILAPPEAGLRDLERCGWIVEALWPEARGRFSVAGLPRPEKEEALAAALIDPFLPGDPPAALYWLWRCALDKDEAGLAQVKQVVEKSPSRMVRDAAAVARVG